VFQFLGLCGGRVESIFSLALAADKKAKSKSKSKCSGSADAFSAHAPLVCAAGVGGKLNCERGRCTERNKAHRIRLIFFSVPYF